jgi:putative exporter of polyketide antibiotics
MRKIFSLALWFLFGFSAKAHDSLIPHTHSLDHRYSDFVIWTTTSLAILTGVVATIRIMRKRRRDQ